MGNSANKLDKNLNLPIKSEKNLWEDLRKFFELPPNEDITDQFNAATNIENIEKELFGKVKKMSHSNIIIRVYISAMKLEGKKFMKKVKKNKDTRMFVGLQIANKILHWDENNLVLITDWESANATAVIYPQDSEGNEIPAIKNSPENRKKIATLIQNWNCTKLYSAKCNSQTFAEAIFKELELDVELSKFKGSVGEYIRYVLSSKEEDVLMYPCLIIKDKPPIVFKTHNQLDVWHEENKESMDLENNEIKSLLRAFHRAFQLRKDVDVQMKCPYSIPTLLVEDGETVPIINLQWYSDSEKK